MKSKKILYLGLSILFTLISFSSCDNAEDEDYGSALLYIPQAVVQSAGVNNHYEVKLVSKGKEDTTIVVGLYRSGLQKLESVNVDLGVAADADLSDFPTGKVLPTQYYTLPSSIGLKDGERESWVGLEINKNQLLQNWESGVTRYLLPVRISNPTKYELNEKLSTVIFVFQK